MITARSYIRGENSTLYTKALAVAKRDAWDDETWKRLAEQLYSVLNEASYNYDYYETSTQQKALKGIYRHFLDNDAEELSDDDRGTQDEGFFYALLDRENYGELFSVLEYWKPALAAGLRYRTGGDGNMTLEEAIKQAESIIPLIPFVQTTYDENLRFYKSLANELREEKKKAKMLDAVLAKLRDRLDDNSLPASIYARYALLLLHNDRYKTDGGVYEALFKDPKYVYTNQLKKYQGLDGLLLVTTAIKKEKYQTVEALYREKRVDEPTLINLLLEIVDKISPGLVALIQSFTDDGIVNLLHRSAQEGKYALFAIAVQFDFTPNEWTQLLYDAVDGGDYRIVKGVMDDERTIPEEELGLHHELYFLAMNHPANAPALVATLLSDRKRYPPRDAIYSAEKLPEGPSKVAILALLNCGTQ